jgi:hypothetical protein
MLGVILKLENKIKVCLDFFKFNFYELKNNKRSLRIISYNRNDE